MKKIIIILLISLNFISCFKEPKKINIETVNNYVKEEMSLNVLNKIIMFEQSEFEKWCVAQDFKYYLASNDYDFKNVQYKNDRSLIMLNIPNLKDGKLNISYNTSNKIDYERIINNLKDENYILGQNDGNDYNYSNIFNKVLLNSNEIFGELIYSIEITKK